MACFCNIMFFWPMLTSDVLADADADADVQHAMLPFVKKI